MLYYMWAVAFQTHSLLYISSWSGNTVTRGFEIYVLVNWITVQSHFAKVQCRQQFQLIYRCQRDFTAVHLVFITVHSLFHVKHILTSVNMTSDLQLKEINYSDVLPCIHLHISFHKRRKCCAVLNVGGGLSDPQPFIHLILVRKYCHKRL